MASPIAPATMTRRLLLAAAATSGAAFPKLARAQPKRVLRLGVLNDQSGPYRDGSATSAACIRQAILDFASPEITVEVMVGDHQNKPDIGANIARQWFDQEGVDAIVDVPSSSVALALNSIVKAKNKVHLNCGAVTAELTGSQCTPNTVHWMINTDMIAKSVANVAGPKADKWFFITADYSFGHEMQRLATQSITQAGGRVLGSVTYPFPGTTDFSSLLLQAQASGANVLGLLNSGADVVNSIKQAHEFRLTEQMTIVATVISLADIHGLGLETGEGLTVTETFYWDLNERTRAFTKRLIAAQQPKLYPTSESAGCYASVLHYLKAAKAVGVEQANHDGASVVRAMKSIPTDDDAFGRSTIRADGRQMSASYQFEVKPPSESKSPWDCYKLVGTTSGEDGYPFVAGKCLLGKA